MLPLPHGEGGGLHHPHLGLRQAHALREVTPWRRCSSAEILLIGAAEEAEEELDISLEPERETEASADIFRDLKLERDQHPLEPLFQGDWR